MRFESVLWNDKDTQTRTCENFYSHGFSCCAKNRYVNQFEIVLRRPTIDDLHVCFHQNNGQCFFWNCFVALSIWTLFIWVSFTRPLLGQVGDQNGEKYLSGVKRHTFLPFFSPFTLSNVCPISINFRVFQKYVWRLSSHLAGLNTKHWTHFTMRNGIVTWLCGAIVRFRNNHWIILIWMAWDLRPET